MPKVGSQKKITREIPSQRPPNALHGHDSRVQRISNEEDERHVAIPAAKLEKRNANEAGQGGCYVYGIIAANSPSSLGKSVMGGVMSDVFAVKYDGLMAIASKTNMAHLDATRENALAHEHVVESVMQKHTIIPMSFGTVFRTEDDIRAVLKSIYPSLQDVLCKMEGKIELGLKVTWDRDRVIERLKKENKDIRLFISELAKKHLQSTYFARMQLGRMIDQALAERAVEIVKSIYDSLRPTCVASRDNKPIGERMIMNASFLLERSKEGEFDKIINDISETFKDLTFKYSGPWPPYNFVNIRLKLERAQSS